MEATLLEVMLDGRIISITPHHFFLRLLLMTMAFALPTFASAQETTTEQTGSGTIVVPTETGALVRDKLQALQTMLGNRTVGSRKELLTPLKIQETYDKERKRVAEERRTARIACREALRRANRETKLKTATKCYRGDLALDLALGKSERAYVNALPGIDSGPRALAVTAIDDWLSATETLVDGIDANVFATIEDLTLAKNRLLSHYRSPKRLALLHARMDRERTWLSLIVKRLQTLAESEEDWVGRGTPWKDAAGCLETLTSTLALGEGQNDYGEIQSTYSQYRSMQILCRQSVLHLAALPAPTPETGAAGGN